MLYIRLSFYNHTGTTPGLDTMGTMSRRPLSNSCFLLSWLTHVVQVWGTKEVKESFPQAFLFPFWCGMGWIWQKKWEEQKQQWAKKESHWRQVQAFMKIWSRHLDIPTQALQSLLDSTLSYTLPLPMLAIFNGVIHQRFKGKGLERKLHMNTQCSFTYYIHNMETA